MFIRWIDSTSAFVSLMNRENAPVLLKTIGTTKGVKVSTFSTYLRVTTIESDDDVNLMIFFYFLRFSKKEKITKNFILFLTG